MARARRSICHHRVRSGPHGARRQSDVGGSEIRPLTLSLAEFEAGLPPAARREGLGKKWQDAARQIAALAPKILVLDDDPTGTQTVARVPVWTRWDESSLVDALRDECRVAFILTNSRALDAAQSRDLHLELCRNLRRAAQIVGGPPPLLISRGDSTLRGHYPLETAVLATECFQNQWDGEILIPFFAAGGRVTAHDIHWVREGQKMVPVGQTEFARDPQFGFQASDLRAYIEEKSGGATLAKSVASVSLQSLRAEDVEEITAQLVAVENFGKVIVNATQDADLQVFVVALARAMAVGKRFLFRSAASLVPILAGMPPAPLWKPDFASGGQSGPGLVVVGSFVAKTTRQLEVLRAQAPELGWVEVAAARVQNPEAARGEIRRAQGEIARFWREKRPVCLFSSRDYLGETRGASSKIAAALVSIVQGALREAEQAPAWIVAKGGITSSDIATRALGATRALVLGPIAPGVPVWQLGEASALPGATYVVFPGNVGEDALLSEVYQALAAVSKP